MRKCNPRLKLKDISKSVSWKYDSCQNLSMQALVAMKKHKTGNENGIKTIRFKFGIRIITVIIR